MASKLKTPIGEMTNLGGITVAIRAREARLEEFEEILNLGQFPNGRKLTPGRERRLRHTARELGAELDALRARRAVVAVEFRDDLVAAGKRAATGKHGSGTAQGAPSASVDDWS